ncbi:MAG: hypothetical protein ACOC53_02880 [Candidatus Saliniplasma sp.]
MKKNMVHLLGGFLIFSSFYHSNMDLMPVMTIIPILLVSFAVEKERDELQSIGLIAATMVSSYFIIQMSLGNTLYLLLFTLSFVLPLTLYWKVVLSFDLHFDLKASILAVSYFSVTIITFYLIIYYLNVGEYILSEGGFGAMALVFSAATILVLLPFYASINR